MSGWAPAPEVNAPRTLPPGYAPGQYLASRLSYFANGLDPVYDPTAAGEEGYLMEQFRDGINLPVYQDLLAVAVVPQNMAAYPSPPEGYGMSWQTPESIGANIASIGGLEAWG